MRGNKSLKEHSKTCIISVICRKCFTHQIWCHPPVRSKEHLPSTCYNNMYIKDDHVKLKRASALSHQKYSTYCLYGHDPCSIRRLLDDDPGVFWPIQLRL